MRKRAFSIIFVVIISSVIVPIFPIFLSTAINFNRGQGGYSKLKTSAPTEITTQIVINDLPGFPGNWTWAKDQGYCNGLGTVSDPYVISNLFFNSSNFAQNQLIIENSRKHFVIRDCNFKGHTNWAGIQLVNSTNGVITENWMHPLTGALVWLLNSSNNIVQNNNASGGSFYGILVESTTGIARNNTISNNLITYNLESGIYFLGGETVFNTISDNDIYNNTMGINFDASSDNNTIRGNQIVNSSVAGIFINTVSQGNEFYENCFFTNSIDASDNGFNNFWDNGARGNYWDNYNGIDADNDGIGDVPYNITGIAGSQDNFPLMSCAPLISPPPGIPGYELFLVCFASVASIIGIIFIINKKKSKQP